MTYLRKRREPARRGIRGWMSRAIALTLLLHALVLLWLVWRVRDWPLCLALLLLNHLVLCVAGLLPRCRLLGANWNRLPLAATSGDIALTIDDGPDPLVTPQVLDILDRFSARATFFCIGSSAMAEPELCREIVRRGHAVENHSQRHGYRFSCSGPRAMAREIQRGQHTLLRITGQRPVFFRPPAGLRNPFLDYLLRRCRLRLASWTRRGYDTRERSPDLVLRRLLRGLAAGDILLLHDGNAARTRDGTPVIVAVLPRLLAAIAAQGLTTFTLRDILKREHVGG